MYRTAVPVMLTSKHFDPEKILSDLKLVGSDRIFLALPPLNSDTARQTAVFDKLAEAIPFFKRNGIETGVWFWAFMVEGENDFTPITGFGGKSPRPAA